MVRKTLKKAMRIIRISLSLKQVEKEAGYIITVCISAGNYQRTFVIPISVVKSLIIEFVMSCVRFGRMGLVLLLLCGFLVWIIMLVWDGVGL